MKISIYTNLFVLTVALSGLFAKCDHDKESLEAALYPKEGAVSFSQDFLLAIKSDEPYAMYLDTLSSIDLGRLRNELDSQEKELCFWINSYNALVQAKAKQDTSSFMDKDQFFKSENLMIGGQKISLDDIEQGILRKDNCFKSELVSQFRMDKSDKRIHFALNCGAAACPPIAFYTSEKIDEQLDLAESIFIESTSTYSDSSQILETSMILKWYADDFGGEQGIIELMKKHQIIQEQPVQKIVYTPYDWTLDLNNY